MRNPHRGFSSVCLLLVFLSVSVNSDLTDWYIRKNAKKLLRYAVAAKILVPHVIPIPVRSAPPPQVKIIHQHHFWGEPWTPAPMSWTGFHGAQPSVGHGGNWNLEQYAHIPPRAEYW